MCDSFFQFVHQRVVCGQLLPVHPHTHAFVFRGDDHALFTHAAHHVERLKRFAPPCQLLHVGRHAPFDGHPHLLLDFEEPVGGAKTIQALVGPLVIVVLHPPGDPFTRLLEGFKTGLGQELILECLPEPLDLAQRHGMMRGASNVLNVILLQFLLELRLPAPTGVLPSVVGQHLLGRLVLSHRLTVEFHHVGAGLTAIHAQRRDEAGVIVNEPDDVRRLAQDGIVRDVALPHLVRRGTLEPARRRFDLPAGFLFLGHHPDVCQLFSHGRGTGLHPEQSPQHLGDASYALAGILPLERHDLLLHRLRQFGRR
jgi:hypothetical protein